MLLYNALIFHAIIFGKTLHVKPWHWYIPLFLVYLFRQLKILCFLWKKFFYCYKTGVDVPIFQRSMYFELFSSYSLILELMIKLACYKDLYIPMFSVFFSQLFNILCPTTPPWWSLMHIVILSNNTVKNKHNTFSYNIVHTLNIRTT